MLKFHKAVILATALITSAANAEETPSSMTISASASVNARPDLAIITAGVVSDDKTAAGALSKNNAAMRNVLKTYHEVGIAKKDIMTSNFSIDPQYVHPKRQANEAPPAPQLVGYLVSNQVTVKIRDHKALGKVLDKVVSSGANTIHGLSFMLSNPDPVVNEARKKAVANAKHKAELYASSLGVSLGRILSVHESHSAPSPRMARMSLAADAGGSVPIAAGEQAYDANVTITWELLQK